MGVIRVNYQEIESIRSGYCIGSGKEGRCFLDNNKVIKIYHSFFKQNGLYFDDLEDSNIAFPKDKLLYDKTELIIGYTMPYLKGIDISNGFPSELNLKQLKFAYIGLKELLKKYQDVYMDDICLDNILYNKINNNFNLIDTSRWYPKDNGYLDNINDINWLFTTILIYNLILNDKNICNDKKYKEIKEIYSFYGIERTKRINQMSYNKMNINNMFIEMLNYLIEKQSNIQENKVKTIKDLYNK